MVSGVRAEAKQLARDVRGALQDLSEKEQEILRLRFGIGARTRDRDEVGTLIGVPQKRLQQIEGRALRKLRLAALKGSMDVSAIDQVPARSDAGARNGRHALHPKDTGRASA